MATRKAGSTPCSRPSATKVAPVPVIGEPCTREEVVDLRGVGCRRGGRREDAGHGGQQHADDREDESDEQ